MASDFCANGWSSCAASLRPSGESPPNRPMPASSRLARLDRFGCPTPRSRLPRAATSASLGPAGANAKIATKSSCVSIGRGLEVGFVGTGAPPGIGGTATGRFEGGRSRAVTRWRYAFPSEPSNGSERMCSPSFSHSPALDSSRNRSAAALAFSFCGLAFFVNASIASRMPSGVRSNFTAASAACSFSCGVSGLAALAGGGVMAWPVAIAGWGVVAGAVRIGFAGTAGFTLIAGVMTVARGGLAGAWPSARNGSRPRPSAGRMMRRVISWVSLEQKRADSRRLPWFKTRLCVQAVRSRCRRGVCRRLRRGRHFSFSCP